MFNEAAEQAETGWLQRQDASMDTKQEVDPMSVKPLNAAPKPGFRYWKSGLVPIQIRALNSPPVNNFPNPAITTLHHNYSLLTRLGLEHIDHTGRSRITPDEVPPL